MRNAVLLLVLMLGMAMMPASQASTSDTQKAEAAVFLSEILTETRNPVVAALIQESLNKLENKPQQMKRQVEVPLLSSYRSGLAIPVLMNKSVVSNFIVDTGATYTVITPRAAKQLGIVVTPDMPRKSIATANGVIQAPIVTVASMNVGGIEVHGLQAIVMDLGHDVLLSGLLGMNFFRDIDLTITSNKLILGISHAN